MASVATEGREGFMGAQAKMGEREIWAVHKGARGPAPEGRSQQWSGVSVQEGDHQN